jgi:uncharacterized membrane protein
MAGVREETTMAEAGAQTGAAAATALTTWVEHAAMGIELLAVVIIVAVILGATVLYVSQFLARRADATTYRNYRQQVARALLLGLEVLVAADVIRTVALEPTLQNVLVLGLLVLIRTFLGWSLVVEIEERWRLAREDSPSTSGSHVQSTSMKARWQYRTSRPPPTSTRSLRTCTTWGSSRSTSETYSS